MEDKDFLELLEKYQSETNEQWGEIAKRIGVSRATISNWKSGTPISLKNRNCIIVLAGKYANKNRDFCYLDKCPATPPPDRQLQIILETWNDLTIQQRGDLSSRALEMRAENQEKKEEQCSGFESSNCKVG